jgi:exoribonuclease-2
VLYKTHPARVRQGGEKLLLELEGGRTASVRPKDVTLLHSGPLYSLADLRNPPTADVRAAWELLGGETCTLRELAELLYGAATPRTTWAAWQVVTEGLYFAGTPEKVAAHSGAEVAQVLATREARQQAEAAWAGFLERLKARQVGAGDEPYLREIKDLAQGRRSTSRALHELGYAERPEQAHALLLELGVWDETVDVYPARLGVTVLPTPVELEPVGEEERRDLTHLPAFAIDDEGNQEPDDALSLEGTRLWVHVADVAAAAPPDSPVDLEARGRGATLYLPEGTVHMLPANTAQVLGLGMTEISNALSFGIDLTPEGKLVHSEICLSRVRVQRLSYVEAEERLDEEPLAGLCRLTQAFQARRAAAGAVFIDLPEVKVWVEAGRVHLRPLPMLRSRMLVREAMLLAGEAAAHFAVRRGIPFPYAVQDPAEGGEPLPPGLAGMYALRRRQPRGRVSGQPGLHAGIGLEVYSRVTSPLRRYLDLVAHQQLRAYIHEAPLLDEQAVLERVGAAEAVTGSVNQAESLARRHWTLVYLQQNPGWQGVGVLVERVGRRAKFLLPELRLEPQLEAPANLKLNETVQLALREVNLAELEAGFRIVRGEV